MFRNTYARLAKCIAKAAGPKQVQAWNSYEQKADPFEFPKSKAGLMISSVPDHCLECGPAPLIQRPGAMDTYVPTPRPCLGQGRKDPHAYPHMLPVAARGQNPRRDLT